MSSIYRKGRDGIFYYQAYVRDEKTGKKNKRIFYSLGTRDPIEAKQKQKILDANQFLASKKPISFIAKIFKKISDNKIFSSLAFFVMVFLVYSSDNYPKTVEIDNDLIIESDTIESGKIITAKFKKGSNVHSKFSDLQGQVDSKNEPFYNKKAHASEPKPDPDFEIVRIEYLSKVFNQGKVHVVVSDMEGDVNLNLLCKKVSNMYQEFQNIIICVYSNSKNGIDMAKGIDLNLDYLEKRKSWLAMYSYNEVEGEYFDNSPTDYLGPN